MHPSFPEGLVEVSASYHSVRGIIESNWTSHEDSLCWQIRVPANTTAEVYLPSQDINHISENGKALGKAEGILSWQKKGDRLMVEVGSGRYHFTVSRETEQ
jgi:alpha-L-rhamnosidase